MTSSEHAIALQAERRILLMRSQKVMLDFDLAELYGVETRALKQAMKRNPERFPEDFAFELTQEEMEILRSQNVISSSHGGSRYGNLAFTEQGVAMLSSVLRSDRAVQVNIAIMRAFVRLRQMLSTNAELARRLEDMEKKYDGQFKVVFDALRQLMAPPPAPPKKEIGFHTLANTKTKPKTRAKR
ncbi:MAG: ORF6N domain-containing protein [Verrucomicrobiaceae bacterium]|nr:ORF6N domain-containing protein [Verrucomicrobiaceae bacterium]